MNIKDRHDALAEIVSAIGNPARLAEVEEAIHIDLHPDSAVEEKHKGRHYTTEWLEARDDYNGLVALVKALRGQ